MSYFAEALDDALETKRYTAQELAIAAGIKSHATISKLRKDQVSATAANLEGIVNAFEGDPQTQWNLVIARCKDLVPERFRESFDSLSWQLAEAPATYKAAESKWDRAIETIRTKGETNPDLKQTILFLAQVAQ